MIRSSVKMEYPGHLENLSKFFSELRVPQKVPNSDISYVTYHMSHMISRQTSYLALYRYSSSNLTTERTWTRVRTWVRVRVRFRSRLGHGHKIFWEFGHGLGSGHGHEIFKDFGHGLGRGLGQSHDFGHGHDFRHGYVRKSRTRTNFGHTFPLISGWPVYH